MSLNPRQHARLARSLIDACGGIDEAAGACRVHRSSLSNYQTVDSGHFLPADVMADLEAYCGEPIYSRALFEARPATAEIPDLLNEACEATESAADLQRAVRLASKDGQITPRELTDIARRAAEAGEQIRDVLEGTETFHGIPRPRRA